MVGGMVGAAAASSSEEESSSTTTTTTQVHTTTPQAAALPCNPTVVQIAGVTYYQCGQTYYVQAYGGSGSIYMPVPPPQ
jgi:hypothetical protein